MSISKTPCPECGGQMHRGYERCGKCRDTKRAAASSTLTPENLGEAMLLSHLKKQPAGASLDQLADAFRVSRHQMAEFLADLRGQGKAVVPLGNERYAYGQAPAGETYDTPLVSNADGWHTFGAIGDTHLGSKCERLEELKDIYRIFEANGIKTVLHTGNYIDGESRFNRHELKVHGMDAQLQYMADVYPEVDGITTYMVSGDDHEGWYAQREGVDIGFYMQKVMERGGRTDIKALGYMETFMPLQHKSTGKTAMAHVVHPGGGSAYAISYTMQKQIEAYEGGEKPAIVLAGHYHKAEHLESRNVHGFQTGCFQDQTTFMRKKKLVATIGGWIINARQNPETGAIEEVSSYFKAYYNRGYYTNNRWSLSGPVSLVPRIIGR